MICSKLSWKSKESYKWSRKNIELRYLGHENAHERSYRKDGINSFWAFRTNQIFETKKWETVVR